ncbi:hypothetical protein XBP1_3080025 [Xenorhabdus bovienii str. puntauvense]|uniref:Uncharacterized protein n=2 Tax=Xenorhabdus bovienii TaxID=40576 RepID=A0A077N8F1_XENBV|nr:hypothetical protein XBFFR1_1260026 [Xenorhabdus bovienii str. feltiae France]CDG98486.1 hypothetical protein XBP1_3080025 [Xenorhabdus bovienii str. puntauvense]CDH25182.1 hypothetical protein XBKB1_3820003 [Xenorhabdus bovienii str. kraussei Becker Underwood]
MIRFGRVCWLAQTSVFNQLPLGVLIKWGRNYLLLSSHLNILIMFFPYQRL